MTAGGRTGCKVQEAPRSASCDTITNLSRTKADKVSVVFERIADGKIRVTTSSWDDAKVIWPNQVLEVATIGKQVGLVRVDKPIAYLDIDDTGLVEAGYGPQG
jgi:hypothetical protein